MTIDPEQLQTTRQQALDLASQLHSLATKAPPDHQSTWAEYIGSIQEVVQFLESDGSRPLPKRAGSPLTKEQVQQFGKLLRDRRNAADLSRVQLARRAKLSDATIKFTETARHPPSRATLIRLIGVSELKLGWADVPGQPVPPAEERIEEPRSQGKSLGLRAQLNCWMTPSYDSLGLVAELARFLNGAGGHVEQTNAYLDHASAAAYLGICQNSVAVTGLRSQMPLAQAAKQILTAGGPMALQVFALGAGDGVLEARLAQHLLEASAPRVELCLLDISQPLLQCAYRHAADALSHVANAQVWGIQCDFHHLPLYAELFESTKDRPHRRLFCMLGGTLANLDQEPRFLRQSLLKCEEGDLLLLDIQSISAACDHPEDIKRRDKLFAAGMPPQYAAWLSGPLWRHCKGITSVDFHWKLDSYGPVPGSYALHAIATVGAAQRADRQFSMFRFTRYDPRKLAECLSAIGWEEIGAMPYAGEHSLRLYRKRTGGMDESAR